MPRGSGRDHGFGGWPVPGHVLRRIALQVNKNPFRMRGFSPPDIPPSSVNSQSDDPRIAISFSTVIVPLGASSSRALSPYASVNDVGLDHQVQLECLDRIAAHELAQPLALLGPEVALELDVSLDPVMCQNPIDTYAARS